MRLASWPSRASPCYPRGDEAGKKRPPPTQRNTSRSCAAQPLRSNQLENAVGLFEGGAAPSGSLILSCADETAVEAGGALAVDRHGSPPW